MTAVKKKKSFDDADNLLPEVDWDALENDRFGRRSERIKRRFVIHLYELGKSSSEIDRIIPNADDLFPPPRDSEEGARRVDEIISYWEYIKKEWGLKRIELREPLKLRGYPQEAKYVFVQTPSRR
jgi:hypothetical protein